MAEEFEHNQQEPVPSRPQEPHVPQTFCDTDQPLDREIAL
ncbi:hypothetical protein Vi05172_g1755 [Venturia inaequalis]|nr:hypothetical protein Vi05172_g1755 [Venturia inaequalis]